MGVGPIMCMLGFSTAYSNTFSERLEAMSGEMESDHRDAFHRFMQATRLLHDAVDHALAGSTGDSDGSLAQGLAELRAASDHLTGLGRNLVEMRARLFERESVAPDDPLLARERHFATLDYDGVYARLLAAGAALPGRIYWDELPARLRKEGARGGLRWLDRLLRGLQTDLHDFIGRIAEVARLPIAHRPHVLHASTVEVSAVLVGFTRFLLTCTYVSLLCEETTRAMEAERGRALEPAAAAS